MADNNVKIAINTTADTRAAERASKSIDKISEAGNDSRRSLDGMEDELRQLEAQLRKLPVGSDAFVQMAGRVKASQAELRQLNDESKKLAGTVGRGGNGGLAVLEFSRAFEDAQYGISGVLNNIPNLVMMLGAGGGLAGVISLAAVAGASLWKLMKAGPEEAKKANEDFLKNMDSFRDAIASQYEAAYAEREKASEQFEKQFETSARNIEDEARRTVLADALAAAGEKSEALIEGAKKRIELQRAEQEVARSTGQELLIATRQRDALVLSILAKEREIAEIQRSLELDKSQAKAGASEQLVKAGQRKLDDLEMDQGSLEAQAGAANRVRERLQRERMRMLEYWEKEIERLKAERDATPEGGWDMVGDVKRTLATKAAQKKVTELQVPSYAEQEAAGKVTAMDEQIERFERKVDAAAAQLETLESSAKEAAEEVTNLKDTQAIAKKEELELETLAIEEAVDKSGESAADKVEKIIEKIDASGEEISQAGEQAKDNLSKILEDGKVAENEQVALQQNLTTLITGWKGSTTKMQDFMKQSNDIVSSLTQSFATFSAKQQQLQQQVNQLSSRK